MPKRILVLHTDQHKTVHGLHILGAHRAEYQFLELSSWGDRCTVDLNILGSELPWMVSTKKTQERAGSAVESW